MSKTVNSQIQQNQRQHISLFARIVPPAILSALTFLVYYPSLNYPFQFDDIANITRHFQIRSHTLKELFFSGPRWISSWLNSLHYSIARFEPFTYRLFNVFLHMANGILIFFFLLYALSGLRKKSFFKNHALPISFLTSLFFLLHPVQTQTTSYVIQGQLEGLAAFFTIALAFCFLKIAQSKSLLNKRLLTVLLFVIALLSCGSKEIAIISPVLLVIIDWFFIAQGDWKSLRSRLWIHIALNALTIAIFIHFLRPTFFIEILGMQKVVKNNIGNVITQNPQSVITPWPFFISQFKVALHYIWIFFWPFNISVEYDWVLSRGFFAPDCFFPFLAIMALLALTIRAFRKNKASLFVFAIVWFFSCLAPRSSIIPSPELLFDYKTYLASFGLFFITSAALIALVLRVSNKIKITQQLICDPSYSAAIISLLLALPLGFATIKRNTVWRSGVEFWGNILQNAPGKARAYNNYGVELSQNHKKYKESIPYFRKAIEMDKHYADPCNNLGVAYAALDEIDLAIPAMQQGIRINPYYPEAYNNLASFFLKKKDLDGAEKVLRTALKMRPYYGKAYFNLGRIYLEREDNEKAWECFKNCCTKADMDDELGFGTYGKASMLLQKYDDAIFAYQRVLKLKPNNGDAAFNLANAYFFSKRHDEAIQLYTQLLDSDPNNAKILYNLGESYFVTDKPEQALTCFNKLNSQRHEIPQLYVRIAGCYEKMGKPQKAYQIISELHTDPKVAENFRQLAGGLRNQLHQKYGAVIA